QFKVQQEQQNKIAMAEEMAAKGIASQEAVEELKTTAVEKVREAAGRQINLDYQKIDTESGAAREKAIKNGYNKVVERIEKFAAKRGLKVKFFEGDKYVSGFEKDGTIYINVTEPKVMYKTAIHETLHGLRSNNQAEYESLKKAIFDAAGKNKKLFMTGVRAEMGYVQSASESVQSSVRNDDGTINRDAVEEEVIAKMCEELIDNPQNFVEKLNGDRTAVQAIIDFVKDLIDNVYIEFSDSEKAQMKKAVREAEKALETYMEGKADTSENITKFSVNDDEYLELAKNPEANEAKLQKMVEEAANDLMADSKIRDDEGKLIPVYHGTKEDFYVFDTSVMGGKNGVQEGFGIYTTDNPNVAGSYGERKLKMYANITNPARADKKTIKAKTLAALIKDTCIRQADAMVEDGEYDSNDEAVMDTWVSNYVYTYGMGMEQAYKETAENILKQNSNDMEIVQEVMSGMAIRNYEEAMAFYHNSLMPITKIDGFVTSWENAETGGRSNIILAFDSEQLKAADPVTYGDNGDIIPLSERFKADNADIRFSVDIDNYTENSYTESIWIKDNNL
ncbi:MAG: hypothetical protein IJ339_06700, partial [Oscillospiraceae bacterium]|nr:hypothetical protein [Oscillospiraceae bacterium]